MKRFVIYIFAAAFLMAGSTTVLGVEKKEKKKSDKKTEQKADTKKAEPKKQPAKATKNDTAKNRKSGKASVHPPISRQPLPLNSGLTKRKFDRLIDRNRNGIDDRREKLMKKADRKTAREEAEKKKAEEAKADKDKKEDKKK